MSRLYHWHIDIYQQHQHCFVWVTSLTFVHSHVVTKSHMWTRYILQGDREDLEQTGFVCELNTLEFNLWADFFMSITTYWGTKKVIVWWERRGCKNGIGHQLNFWCINKSLHISKFILKWDLPQYVLHTHQDTYKSLWHTSTYLTEMNLVYLIFLEDFRISCKEIAPLSRKDGNDLLCNPGCFTILSWLFS